MGMKNEKNVKEESGNFKMEGAWQPYNTAYFYSA